MKRRITHDRTLNQPFNSHQPAHQTGKRPPWGLIITGSIFLILFVVVILLLTKDLPTLEQLEKYEQKFSTKLYSLDLKILKELYFIKRTYTPLDSIPEHLKQAALSTEDREFFDHWGFNSKRFAKAMLIDLFAMRYEQGASTLSQQLARGLFLTQEKKIIRKLRELLLSLQIEYTYTKNEILEMYLNHMYYGHGAYGVQAASKKYFEKNVADLTLDQSALLIALLKAPNYFSPYRHPEAGLQRRNLVLHNMLVCDFISREEYEQACAIEITTGLKTFDAKEEFGTAPYFTEWVRQYLQSKYGIMVYTDGLSVYTTIDTRIQACAEVAVKNHLPTIQAKVTHNFKTRNQYLDLIPPSIIEKKGLQNIKSNPAFIDSIINANAAVQVGMVALDPSNGYILAMIGGRDFEESKWNRVVQTRRQPGSAFKPIAYATAIDNGYSPSNELLNQPVVVYLDNGQIWRPMNYDHSEGGPTTLREGLRKSYNLIAVRLVQELVPPARVVEFARNLGIESFLDPVDALALGSCGVTPIELTSAYGVFANKGILAKPIGILKVVDKYGNVLEENYPDIREAMREEVAYIMTSMLQTVIDQGTGAGARSRYNFRRPAAGKTGTTNDYTDGWFIGYTPTMVAGVWCGLDEPKYSLGRGQEGARVAVPIWAPFMKTACDTMLATTNDTLRWGHDVHFVRPSNVVECDICTETKKLATEFCPHIVREVFVASSAPQSSCDVHKGHSKTTNRRHF
jgi:penicillin-binding protein 1A